MKKNKIKIVLLGLVVGLVVGLMVGFILMNPGMTGMNVWEAAGTIGRVDQYRNVRVTEADIELRNELLADENMREAYRNYLAYEYTANIKMGDDLRFAILAGGEHEDFSTNNARTLARMEEYTHFLDNARLRILEAIGTISDLSDRGDRVAIRTVLNSAGNALAQTQLRNGVVFDFMADVESFFKTNPKAEFPQLVLAHDQLFANILMHNIVNDNRPVLEHLLAKEVMDEDGEFAQLDTETLRGQVIQDVATLGDVSTVGTFMNEAVLGLIIMDIAALNAFYGVQDAAHLRDFLSLDVSLLDFAVAYDAETLRLLGLNSEQLRNGDLMFDTPMLQMTEVLRGSEMMRNSDFLAFQHFDSEQLRTTFPL